MNIQIDDNLIAAIVGSLGAGLARVVHHFNIRIASAEVKIESLSTRVDAIEEAAHDHESA
jgi:hypothetical protein